MQPIIYPKSGRFALVRYNADGSLRITGESLIGATGTVQSIAPSVNFETTELDDGNSDWPMGVYDIGKSGQIEVTMSSFQPNLYAALIGSELTREGSGALLSVDEEMTVPDEAPYTVDLEHKPDSDTVVIVDAHSSPMVKSSTVSQAGEYSVSNGSVTFHSADAGKAMFATYEWTASNVEVMGLPESGIRPVLHAIFSGYVTSEDEIQKYHFTTKVDKVKATGDISPPEQQRGPQPWTFTLQVLKPRAGRLAIENRFALAE